MSQLHRWCAPLAVFVLLASAACDDQAGWLPEPQPSPAGGPSTAVIASTGCNVHHSAFNRGLTDRRQINEELNDWGRLLIDADGQNGIACVDSAASALRDKLKATLDGDSMHYSRFLSGGLVALIYAAGDRIGANGGMTPALDAQLERVERHFAYSDVEDGCGPGTTDSCMDGHSVGASGYAWLAAYRYSRGWSPAAARAATESHIRQTFTSACIFNGYERDELCNGTVDSLRAGIATTLSLNIGQQSIPYGFGLMTSVAAAVLGYDASGTGLVILDDEKVIARALFAEAQRSVSTTQPFVFLNTCPGIDEVSDLWKTFELKNCGEGTYSPRAYGLYYFYLARIGQIPGGTYQSSVIDPGVYELGTASNGFMSWGRWATYRELGHTWWKTPRAHRPRTDAHLPIGYLEQIASNRYAYGWACDRDKWDGSVRVELRAPGRTPIVTRAALASEASVNSNCGGGTAYRFSVALPSTWAGLTVTAVAIDYLGYRSATLSCLSVSGCVVPQPANVSVAWVQPSGVTWGPPNTLTVAGYAGNGTGTVQMQWRDASINGAWTTVSYQAPLMSDGTWTNTIPVSNYCHDYQVKATYSGVTSATFTYRGLTSGHCPEQARIIWIQPQTTAGFGTPGALVVAGEAKGAPAGTTVKMWWRDVTANGGWTTRSFAAPTDDNGIWINDIPNADFTHRYAVYVVYDVFTSQTCTYAGANNITWC